MATLNVAIKFGGAVDQGGSQAVGGNAAYNFLAYTVPANSYLQVQGFSTNNAAPTNIRIIFPNGGTHEFSFAQQPNTMNMRQKADGNSIITATPMLLPAGTTIRGFGTNGIIATTFSLTVQGVLFQNTQ